MSSLAGCLGYLLLLAGRNELEGHALEDGSQVATRIETHNGIVDVLAGELLAGVCITATETHSELAESVQLTLVARLEHVEYDLAEAVEDGIHVWKRDCGLGCNDLSDFLGGLGAVDLRGGIVVCLATEFGYLFGNAVGYTHDNLYYGG